MKRFLDVLLSLLAIIFLSPLMLIISLIIICDDGLPVIFRQNRVGKGDELFKIKKFRTMKNGAPNLSTADFEQSDEFITRSGKFLRRTSLDELPQLFNVLARREPQPRTSSRIRSIFRPPGADRLGAGQRQRLPLRRGKGGI